MNFRCIKLDLFIFLFLMVQIEFFIFTDVWIFFIDPFYLFRILRFLLITFLHFDFRKFNGLFYFFLIKIFHKVLMMIIIKYGNKTANHNDWKQSPQIQTKQPIADHFIWIILTNKTKTHPTAHGEDINCRSIVFFWILIRFVYKSINHHQERKR